MKSTVKLACVEYYNTLPFLHGLSLFESSEVEIELVLAPPAECSQLYLNDTVDIALIPVGAIDKIDEYRIMSAYCIGCNGPVDTVAVLSQVPIQSIQTLHLDPQSNTSNCLVQILFKEYWEIDPQYSNQNKDYDQESILAIGDKVFELESNYQYKYDLGAIWKEHTGLPFVFAVWICKPSVNHLITQSIDTAFQLGLSQPEHWIPTNLSTQKDQLMTYLTKNIVFPFDDSMQEALNLFELKLEILKHGYRNHTK